MGERALRRGRRAGGDPRGAAGRAGELVDLSMSEVANTTATTAADLMDSLRGRPTPDRPGRSFETPSIEPTSDGWVGFNTNTPHQFDGFLLMIERPDLIEDGYWASIADRIQNWEEWNGIIHEWTTKHTTAEVVALAAELRIPVAPVCDGPTVADARARRRARLPGRRPDRHVPRATPTVEDRRRGGAPAPSRAPAGRAHRPHRAPRRRSRRRPARRAAARGAPGARPHRLVGGPVGDGAARRARRRRRSTSSRSPGAGRHALHRRPRIVRRPARGGSAARSSSPSNTNKRDLTLDLARRDGPRPRRCA